MQMADDLSLFPAEPGLIVTDVMNGHARQVRQQVRRDGGRSARFAGEHHPIGGYQRFARDAGIGIRSQVCVQYGVAEAVSHLVRMAFGNGFRGEQEFARIAHGWVFRLAELLLEEGFWCVKETPGRVKATTGMWPLAPCRE